MTQECDTRELLLESDTREKLDSDTTHVGAHLGNANFIFFSNNLRFSLTWQQGDIRPEIAEPLPLTQRIFV